MKGHLAIDDLLVALALICLLVSAIVQQSSPHQIFLVQDVTLKLLPKPPDFQAVRVNVAKYYWIEAYLFFTGIWAVKGSFLAYYDSLTQRLPWYRRAWWVTTAITILTYIGSLLAYGFLNGLQFKTNPKNRAINYQFSADFVTDVLSARVLSIQVVFLLLTILTLVTAMPITLALKSKISTRQKAILSGIFSLTLVITILSLLRYLFCGPSGGTALPSWLGAWSFIEQSMSVVIACLASVRTLFISQQRRLQKSSERKQRQTSSGLSGKKSKIKQSLSRLERTGSMELELLDRIPSNEDGLRPQPATSSVAPATLEEGSVRTKHPEIDHPPDVIVRPISQH